MTTTSDSDEEKSIREKLLAAAKENSFLAAALSLMKGNTDEEIKAAFERAGAGNPWALTDLRVAAAERAGTYQAAANEASRALRIFTGHAPHNVGVRHAAVAAALAKEESELAKDTRASGALEQVLLSRLERLHRSIEELDEGHEEPPIEDGIFAWDARFAVLVSGHGQRGEGIAKQVREKAAERLSLFRRGELIHVGLMKLWFAKPNAPAPRFVIALASVLWCDVVAPQLAREHRNTRMPTSAIDLWSRARTEGATVMPNGNKLRVQPPKGHTLLLPWDGEHPIGDGKVSVLSILDGQATRVWVATWALWTRQGCPDHGEFKYFAEEVLEDLFGGKLVPRGKDRRSNLNTRSVDRLNRTIRLLSLIDVTEAGDYEQLRPEALVNVRRRKSTREATLVHAGIVVKAVRDSYVQLPQNICRVDYFAMPMAIGVGRLIRPKASELDLAAPRVHLSVQSVLEAAGEDIDSNVRKHGPQEHWRRAGERIVTVIEEAGFGKARLPGNQCHGGEDPITVELATHFAEGYRPLIESRAARIATKVAEAASKKHARAKALK